MGSAVKRMSTLALAMWIGVSNGLSMCTIDSRAADQVRAGQEYEFTGGGQTFIAPQSGRYKFTVCGAQGGINSTLTTGDNNRARPVQAAGGGVVQVEYLLMAGDVVYINVGGAGSSTGAGGYNGGGSSTGGGAGGGGATSVALVNKPLSQLTSDEIIAVAGGGGGSPARYIYATTGIIPGTKTEEQLPEPVAIIAEATDGGGVLSYGTSGAVKHSPSQDKWILDRYETFERTWLISMTQGKEYSRFSLAGANQLSGHSRGVGANGTNGAGGGGGGYWGGYSSNMYWAGGTGGSGHASSKCLATNLDAGSNTGNGRVIIDYLGQLQSTVNVDLGNIGTRNGASKFNVQVPYGTKINVASWGIQLNTDYTLEYFTDTVTGKTYDATEFTVDSTTINLKAYGYAGLYIHGDVKDSNTVKITFGQDDDIYKRYKLYTYVDGTGWSNIKYESEIKGDTGGQGDIILDLKSPDKIDGNSSNDVYNNNTNLGKYVKTWTVPETGYYRIDAASGWSGVSKDAGAGDYGGDKDEGAYPRFSNAVYQGTVELRKGDVYRISVGQCGENGRNNPDGEYHSNEDVPGRHGWPRDVNDPKLKNYEAKVGSSDKSDGNQMGGGLGGFTAMQTSSGTYILKLQGGLAAQCHNQGADKGKNGVVEMQPAGGLEVKTSQGTYPEGMFKIKRLGSSMISNMNSYELPVKDLEAPNTPSAGVLSNATSRNIQLSWADNGDRGTIYKYRAESFNSNDVLIASSGVLNHYHESGVAGWHWYIDGNPSGTVTKQNQYTSTNKITVSTPKGVAFLHVAAVDKAGNLGGTYNFRLPLSVNIYYDKNNTALNKYGYTCTTTATGNLKSHEISSGTTGTLKNNVSSGGDIAFTKTGYTFTGWNTSPDGSGIPYEQGARVEWSQLINLGLNVTMYAQWEPIEYSVTLHKNKPSNATSDIVNKLGVNWYNMDGFSTRLFQFDNPNDTLPDITSNFGLLGWTPEVLWYRGGNGTGAVSGGTFTKNQGNLASTEMAKVNAYIKWNPNRYTIVYDGNQIGVNIYGDKVSTSTTGTTLSTDAWYDNNVTLAMNNFSKVGYKFKNWNTKPDNTGKSYEQGETLIKPNFVYTNGGTITLYAIWEPITYQIRFNSNDPTESGMDYNETDTYFQEVDGKNYIRYDQPFTLNDIKFTRDNSKVTLPNGEKPNTPYTFRGWGLTDTQTRTDYSNKQQLVNFEGCTEDKKVYDLWALWSRPIELTFNMNGGEYQGSSDKVTLSGELWNRQLIYPFNITGGLVQAVDGKWSTQVGKIDAYGNYDADGVNNKFTYVKDGVTNRFIGFADSPDATEPVDWISPYSDKVTNVTYEAYNSKDLYAVWEQVLQVNLEVGRVLGNLSDTSEAKGLTSGTGRGEVYIKLRPGEQGYYNFITPNVGAHAVIDFDDWFSLVYDEVGTWTDQLNPSTDEDLHPNQTHGLDRGFLLTGNDTRKFYAPNEIGTVQGPPNILNKTDYEVVFGVTQDSYYWETVHNSKEIVAAICHIEILKDSIDEPGSGGSGSIDEEMDPIYNDLETHIEID